MINGESLLEMVNDEQRYVLVYDTEWMSVIHDAYSKKNFTKDLKTTLGTIKDCTKLSDKALNGPFNMITQIGIYNGHINGHING